MLFVTVVMGNKVLTRGLERICWNARKDGRMNELGTQGKPPDSCSNNNILSTAQGNSGEEERFDAEVFGASKAVRASPGG